ncbi:MAG: amino acid permease [Candidatus Cloacimonetes bacterium]|nr:amino acid permease [Candidatus Cloacimonadota bacterium]MBS3767876.1 amino acid permease [Candidatus Cloacimonadota bacterium]
MKDKLDKNISLLTAFSIAAGAMISSGLFVLPGVVYTKTGPAIILVYFLAGLLMIPTLFAQSELATAMPKAGGAYIYSKRILGGSAGMIAGFTNWFSIAMKTSFALIGIGTFLTLMNPEVPEIQIRLLAAGAAIFFTIINLFSTKHAGNLQTIMVLILLAILTLFLISGYPQIKLTHYQNFFAKGRSAFFAAVGMVFISFGGLINIASMSEEIKKSGKNIPKAMFLAFFIMMGFYILVIASVVGILPHDILTDNLAPVSIAAKYYAGNIGLVLMSITAMLAFVTTANAGIMSASRAPLAMGRDGLIPDFFTELSYKHRIPYKSVIFTGSFITAVILALHIDTLVKVASAMMLFLFILTNFSLIVIRKLSLRNYKPTFKAPFFPYLQIFAIVIYLLLIYQMGPKILLMTIFMMLICLGWYYFYAREHADSRSALILLIKRIADEKLPKEMYNESIEEELFELLQHREEIMEDFFDKIVKKGIALDIDEEINKDTFFKIISEKLSTRIGQSKEMIYDEFLNRERESSTNVAPRIAIPHIIIPGEDRFQLALVRAKKGIKWEEKSEPVKAVFVLMGSLDKRDTHLKALMAVSQIVQNEKFFQKWESAENAKDLCSVIMLMPRSRVSKPENK